MTFEKRLAAAGKHFKAWEVNGTPLLFTDKSLHLCGMLDKAPEGYLLTVGCHIYRKNADNTWHMMDEEVLRQVLGSEA